MVKQKKATIKNPLITAQELNAILGKEAVKIFDVRGVWGKNPSSLFEDYNKEHIPTASFLDWKKEFIEQDKTPNLAQIASKSEVAISFKRLGIHKEDTVILYDENNHMFAGRIWWAMRYWGFTNVYVLNGGFKYWKAQNFPTSQVIPKNSEGTFAPKQREYLRVPLEELIPQKETSYLLDGRGVAGYNGKTEDPRTGHIPGAISTPYNVIVDKETGLFHTKQQLITYFNKNVPDWQNQPIICSCGSGYSGMIVMLALASLGIEASFFDESFSVWKLDPKRPVEQSL